MKQLSPIRFLGFILFALPMFGFAEGDKSDTGIAHEQSAQALMEEAQRKAFGFVPAPATERRYEGPHEVMPSPDVVRQIYGFVPAPATEQRYQGPHEVMPSPDVIRQVYGFVPAPATEQRYQGPHEVLPPGYEQVGPTQTPAVSGQQEIVPQESVEDAQRKAFGFVPAPATEQHYQGPHEVLPPGDTPSGSAQTPGQDVHQQQPAQPVVHAVPWPNGAEAFNPARVTQVSFAGCNAVAFASHPDLGLTLIGRETALGGCDDSKGWSLTLAQLDWNTKSVTKIKTLFDGLKGAWSADRQWFVSTAYDPTIEKINGQLWVAFECGLSRTEGGPYEGTASSCAAPLVSGAQGYELDINRLSVLVRGDRDPVSGNLMSASVPKLVVFKGEPLLFWTAVDVRPFGSFGQLTTRAVRLNVQNGLLKVAGANPTISSMEAPSVEVLGPSNGSPFGRTADFFQIIAVGDSLIGTGAASDLCTVPTAAPECYRVFFAQTSNPLEPGSFGKNVMPLAGLPEHAQQYLRFLRGPDGETYLMGHFPFKGTRSDLSDGVIIHWPERWL